MYIFSCFDFGFTEKEIQKTIDEYEELEVWFCKKNNLIFNINN